MENNPTVSAVYDYCVGGGQEKRGFNVVGVGRSEGFNMVGVGRSGGFNVVGVGRKETWTQRASKSTVR